MKRILYLALAAAAGVLMVSCNEKATPGSEHPALVRVTYNALEKGEVTGSEIYTLPVSASADGADLNLNFLSSVIYLQDGTYTVGDGIGNYSGHFKNSWLDADIVGGMLTVTVQNEVNYAISGTVRLNDDDGTAVRIRAAGEMVYEFPTEHYYTVETGVEVDGFNTTVYKVYGLDNIQLAEVTVVGEGYGPFTVTNTGAEGTALYGKPNGGTWFWEDSYGTNVMIHGEVSMAESHGRLNFLFNDAACSTTIANCEKVDSITPVDPVGADVVPYSTRVVFHSIESPLVEGMYELTVKMFFPDGREFQTMTLLAPTPNPAMENPGAGNAFMLRPYESYLTGTGNLAVSSTCFYRIGGKKIGLNPAEPWAALLNYGKMDTGTEYCLVVFLNAVSMSLPEDVAALSPGDMYGFMGFIY